MLIENDPGPGQSSEQDLAPTCSSSDQDSGALKGLTYAELACEMCIFEKQSCRWHSLRQEAELRTIPVFGIIADLTQKYAGVGMQRSTHSVWDIIVQT